MTIPQKADDWTVLIVDDEVDNLTIPQELLTYYGAKVYSASNGLEGLKILSEIEPTFILLDLSMPEMSGWEMLTEVRANPRWETLPVIALTAHAMAEDEERVRAAGFTGYIAKPYWLHTFWDEIERCLSPVLKR